jgi:hypothetical protein
MSGNGSISLSSFNPKLVADGSDGVIVTSAISNGDFRTPVANLFVNTVMKTINVVLSNNSTPANSTANVVGGSIWSDGTYIYVAPSNNVIKRVALTSF